MNIYYEFYSEKKKKVWKKQNYEKWFDKEIT